MQALKNTLRSTLRNVPPYCLLLLGIVSVLSYGLVKLLGMLQDAGLGQ